MNLAMTIGTVSANNHTCRISGITKFIHAANMGTAFGASQSAYPYIGVTGLTQLWSLFDQQSRMIGTMHSMAQCAIFNNRVVFPQKRTPLFGMAGIAIVVNGELF